MHSNQHARRAKKNIGWVSELIFFVLDVFQVVPDLACHARVGAWVHGFWRTYVEPCVSTLLHENWTCPRNRKPASLYSQVRGVKNRFWSPFQPSRKNISEEPQGSIPLYHFTKTYSFMDFDDSFRPVANINEESIQQRSVVFPVTVAGGSRVLTYRCNSLWYLLYILSQWCNVRVHARETLFYSSNMKWNSRWFPCETNSQYVVICYGLLESTGSTLHWYR